MAHSSGSELDVTAKTIEALELKKSHLLKEASDVDLQLRHARAKYGRLLNQNAHIYKLPTEILSHIFMICQQTPGPKAMSVPFEILVSQVSSMFREIAIGTPLLWIGIAIIVRMRPHNFSRKVLEWKLARVRVYLERSGSCLFTTSFDIVGPFQVDQILNLISLHALRWLRLSISIKNPPAATLEIWQALHSISAPALNMSLSGSRGCPWGAITSAIAQIANHSFSGAGHLRSSLFDYPAWRLAASSHHSGWSRRYTSAATLLATPPFALCWIASRISSTFPSTECTLPTGRQTVLPSSSRISAHYVCAETSKTRPPSHTAYSAYCARRCSSLSCSRTLTPSKSRCSQP
ncbi:hypothetical protein K438DRAFT_423995 [Mycena galopus ATCC 62051]|nr:hypothetical protein K438DRAFT_423995 [Mycena galopus ATCC 62051]